MGIVLPANENARLAALQSYRLLDSETETRFDDLVKLAAAICGTPIALMVLLDADRQWFKSRVGLEATETPWAHAFCAHAILDHEVFVVENACEDERFRDNPLVTDAPGIRFYAGAPLRNEDGFALGTLCVIDREPRALTSDQRRALAVLADQVVGQMELRRVTQRLADALQSVERLERLLPVCAWCKRVRDDGGYWSSVEDYLLDAVGQRATHGICPSCTETQLGLATTHAGCR